MGLEQTASMSLMERAPSLSVAVSDEMTMPDTPSAAERRRARRHKIAGRLYEELVAQNPNRVITLCDDQGNVMAHHDPLPEHDAPEIASLPGQTTRR